MDYFLLRTLKLILLPFALLSLTVVVWDPFKIYFPYDEYYKSNVITGNREDTCFKLLNKRQNKPVNYIIGNSRSHAFKTPYWAAKIDQDMERCFHYDGSAMGIYRASNAIQYIDRNIAGIENILLIVDTEFFTETSNPESHLFIQHPDVSGENRFQYYWTFFKSSFDARFLLYNMIYRVTGRYYDFMGHHISKSKNNHVSDNLTGDLWYSYDTDIENDSIGYYKDLLKKNVFYLRSSSTSICDRQIDSQQFVYLKAIKEIVDKNNADLKVIISPLYNQREFNHFDKQILCDLFGENNVFDFSGRNAFTEDYTNYYESSHFKPYVANQILDIVYSKTFNGYRSCRVSPSLDSTGN